MSGEEGDLRSFYENEARLQLRRPRRGRRVELREEFVDLLRREGRGSVLDCGAGPGSDSEAFSAAGFHVVGVDLAHGNGLLAAGSGLLAIQGSMLSLPIKRSSFEAGWSASTLMHLAELDAARAIGEMVEALQPGAPLVVGIWGREVEVTIVDDAIPGSRRPFHLRSFERNRRLLAIHGDVERSSRWDAASEDWDYQVFRLRTTR